MNKKIIIIVCFLLIVAMCFSVKRNYFVNTKNNIDKNEYDNKKYENMLSMMLETSAGTGEYQEALASSWPTEGYAFNENLSKCENGSSLSWDNINKKFPNWRKNPILKKKNLKNLYIKSNNKVTFKIYCFFLHLL